MSVHSKFYAPKGQNVLSFGMKGVPFILLSLVANEWILIKLVQDPDPHAAALLSYIIVIREWCY